MTSVTSDQLATLLKILEESTDPSADALQKALTNSQTVSETELASKKKWCCRRDKCDCKVYGRHGTGMCVKGHKFPYITVRPIPEPPTSPNRCQT